MAVTAASYGNFIMNLGKGRFNFDTDTVKAMLTTSVYVPNVDTHQFATDVTGEITGTGYTAGGQALTGVTWTWDAANKRGVLGANTVTWTAATFTARYAVIYRDAGSPATSLLIGYVDFGVDRSPAAEDFQLTNASGVLRIRAV